MNVALVGAGRVGLVAAACLADFGITVHCVDNQKEKIETLQNGTVPFHEPGLNELVQKNVQAGRLSFSSDLAETVRRSLVIFFAVGTEEEAPGVPNLHHLFNAARQVAQEMTDYKVLVIKSTVPVGTAQRLANELRRERDLDFDIVSNPEFLREGSAIENFMRPDRVVLGGASQHALAIMKDIYRPLYLIETPIIVTDNATAELSKYASNAFLAIKIGFINEMANLADCANVDVHEVAKIVGLDKRIGPKFLHPGPGYGGSCLPKDTRALVSIGHEYGLVMDVVEGSVKTNSGICGYLVSRLKKQLGSLSGMTISVLGLAYKPFTDDVRESRAVDFLRLLLDEGAVVQAYDPAANQTIADVLEHEHLRLGSDAYEAANGADAVAILTEWNEFRNLDLPELKARMKGQLLLDCRNVLDPEVASSHGFFYLGRGRGPKVKTGRSVVEKEDLVTT